MNCACAHAHTLTGAKLAPSHLIAPPRLLDASVRYHATAKGLMVAEQEGRLPKKAHFKTEELAEWWATKLEFDKFLSPDPEVIDALRTVPLKLVAFTNGPRCAQTNALNFDSSP